MSFRIVSGWALCLSGLFGLVWGLILSPSVQAQETFQDSRVDGMGRVDATPAATLLLPYFEVDLDDINGPTTLFSINNASPESILAHVVVWTDLGIPVLSFQVFLTGFDVQALNMRDVLQLSLPATSPLDSELSPQGALSSDNPDLDTASCAQFLPPPALGEELSQRWRDALTGQPTELFGNQCVGVEHGDNVARGFVTVDAVRECSLLLPGDPGYFIDDGQGVATNDNVLWGDVVWADPTAGTAASQPLVHLEARGSVANGYWNPGNHTFYGRVNASLEDNREPLPTSWMALGGAFEHTELLVWRDPGVTFEPFTCGIGALDGSELEVNQLLFFDEEENLDIPNLLFAFPWAAQRFTVATPHSFGWTFVDLLDPQIGVNDLGGRQGHVTVLRDAGGSFLTGHPGIPVPDPVNTDPLIFADGFESGDVAAWSGVVQGDPVPAPIIVGPERLASLATSETAGEAAVAAR